MRRLNQLKRQAEPITVEQIVRAFLEPTTALRDEPAGRRFLRLQARLHTEPAEISYRLRNEAYDVSTRAFVNTLLEICPTLSAKDVNWCMALTIGAYMYAFSDTHRLDELAPTECDPNDTTEVIEEITAFVTAGLRAPPVYPR